MNKLSILSADGSPWRGPRQGLSMRGSGTCTTLRLLPDLLHLLQCLWWVPTTRKSFSGAAVAFLPLKVICREGRSCLRQETRVCHRRGCWGPKSSVPPRWELHLVPALLPGTPKPTAPPPRCPSEAGGQHGGRVLFTLDRPLCTERAGTVIHARTQHEELLFHPTSPRVPAGSAAPGTGKVGSTLQKASALTGGISAEPPDSLPVSAPTATLAKHPPTPRAK